MFLFKSSVFFIVALAAIHFEYISAATLPESQTPHLQSNYPSAEERVDNDVQNDDADLEQMASSYSPVTVDHNSTQHSLEPSKGWFYRAVDFVENAFSGMLDKSTSFVKGFEEKNTDDEKNFWNRSSQVIEVLGEKFLKVRTVEKKISNNSIAFIEKEVIKPLTA